MSNEINTETQSTKRKPIISILLLVVGLAALTVGSFNIINNQAANQLIVSIGEQTVAQGITDENRPYVEKTVTVIDSAIAARTGDVAGIKAQINDGLTAIMAEDTAGCATVVIAGVISYVNSAYSPTATEQTNIENLQKVSNSIKKALNQSVKE